MSLMGRHDRSSLIRYRPSGGLSGMILFDKPQGWTSHDAAEAFRRMLPPKTKVGHCGALDPLATGLLILLVGPCTRLQARFQKLDKAYSGAIRLGVKTDSGDITGAVIETKPVAPLDVKALQAAMDGFHGLQEMNAPVFSAVKYKGRALYAYARKGIEVPPQKRTSEVYEWKAVSYAEPDVQHVMRCSSGTYVRAVAELLGDKLGCGATVATLRRDSVAHFKVGDAVTLEAAKKLNVKGLQDILAGSLKGLFEFAASVPEPRD